MTSTTSPTLLVMAAGLGSRYGGLKQLDPVGPSGDVIVDYSIYDAIRAGFSGRRRRNPQSVRRH